MSLRREQDWEASSLSDADLDRRARARDEDAVRELMRRYNRRLYRTALSILNDRRDAEEAVQDAYVKAFCGRAAFQGEASYGTWLTRIAINEAIERKRLAGRRARLFATQGIADMTDYRARLAEAPVSHNSPEQSAARAECVKRLERAVEKLPEPLRIVFMLRDINGASVEETAAALDIEPATVKTRLLRARRKLQEILAPDLRAMLEDTFPFAGRHCAELTERVLAAISKSQ